jgi:hypothetical protein
MNSANQEKKLPLRLLSLLMAVISKLTEDVIGLILSSMKSWFGYFPCSCGSGHFVFSILKITWRVKRIIYHLHKKLVTCEVK